MKELKYLNKYLYKYRKPLLYGVFITILARIFALVTPKIIGNSVNTVDRFLSNTTNASTQEIKNQLLINILTILGATLIAALLTFLMRQTFIVVSRKVEFDLKNEIYNHYQLLSPGFYKMNRTGDLMNRISEDVSKVRMYLGPALMYSVQTLSLFVVVISYMYSQAPLLTLYAVLPLPVLSFAIYKLSAAINKRSTVVQQFLSKLTTFTQESFSGISVIKSYALEQKINHGFVDLAHQSRDKSIDLVKVQALFFPLMILLIGVSNLLVIYVGGNQYINGQIQELGTIVEFIIFINILTWPVAVVGWVTSMVQQAEASQRRINEFLKQNPEIANNNPESSEIVGKIEFKNVSLTYPDTQIKALNNVSFMIQPGETLAILGNTGSGKTSVLDLIGRLYDPDSGEVLMDGVLIDQLNLYDLRKAISYVPQDAFLFSDTIANNIKFGREDANEDEVIQAAKNAAVHDNIIEFVKGYETMLGERGITVSGGQKQRISIARALIKDAAIYLFDDSLSAVDTETEEEILNNLKKIFRDKTTILVSHRVSAAKTADRIIVLNNGEIIEQGTHNQLITLNGHYKDLYEKQLTEKET